MIRLFLFVFFLVSSVGIHSAVVAVADEEFYLRKVNVAMFYELCPEVLMDQEHKCSPESYELRWHDKQDLSYEEFVAKCKEDTEKRNRELDASFDCSIHGTYFAYKGATKIGIISLSNAAGEFYADKAPAYGFSSGEYVCRDIFLDEGHKGKGYFSHLHAKVMELITPFIGRKHIVRNAANELVESESAFKGTRGLTALANVPSIRASLKAGATLVDIPEDRNQWIVQFPAPQRALSERELELRQVADIIIAESLDSFRTEPFEYGDIPSTKEAQAAVQKHYYGNKILFPDV